jgi:hypothetical protein
MFAPTLVLGPRFETYRTGMVPGDRSPVAMARRIRGNGASLSATFGPGEDPEAHRQAIERALGAEVRMERLNPPNASIGIYSFFVDNDERFWRIYLDYF